MFGDDFKTVQDSDEIKGKPLLHETVKGTGAPKEFTLNVEGIHTLYIYYNTHKQAGSSVYEKYKRFYRINDSPSYFE